MNSLDEIIESISFCCEGLCEYCVFEEEHKMRNPCTIALMSDAQTYLKEYREMKQHLACMDKGEIRGDDTQIVNNPPLTWAELHEMVGKPVWVEALLYKQWAVIAYAGDEYVRFEGANLYAPESKTYKGEENGWQAYRKERKENDRNN